MVCTYNGILFSQKEENYVICYNMNETWEHYAKWNKSVKNYILYDSIIQGM